MARDEITFQVSTTEFNLAMKELADRTRVPLRTIFRNECQTIVRKLIRFEFRAKPKDIERQLRERLVVDWGGGSHYNVPKKDLAAFTRLPAGALRRFRARKGGKLIPVSGVARYKKRAGYLASGWGRSGEVLGLKMPKFITQHDLGKNGAASTDFNNPHGPRMRLVNKASPGPKSADKLRNTLRIQAAAILRSANGSLERAFARARPRPTTPK